MLRVSLESSAFEGDVAHLDSMDFQSELGGDYVLASRLNISK